MVIVQAETIDCNAVLGEFYTHYAAAGAMASFIGTVRQNGVAGEVRSLYLEHYPPLTLSSIKDIENRVCGKWSLEELLIIHRVGTMAVGETIVVIAAAASHRRHCCAAVECAIDFLKTQAFLWKKELLTDGEQWIEPSSLDYQQNEQWQ